MRIPRYPQGPQYVDKGEGAPRTYVVALQRQEDQKLLQLMVQLSMNSEISEDEVVKSYIENEKKKYLIQARQNE